MIQDDEKTFILEMLALGDMGENDFGVYCLYCQIQYDALNEMHHQDNCIILRAQRILQGHGAVLKSYEVAGESNYYDGWRAFKGVQQAYSVRSLRAQNTRPMIRNVTIKEIA